MNPIFVKVFTAKALYTTNRLVKIVQSIECKTEPLFLILSEEGIIQSDNLSC